MLLFHVRHWQADAIAAAVATPSPGRMNRAMLRESQNTGARTISEVSMADALERTALRKIYLRLLPVTLTQPNDQLRRPQCKRFLTTLSRTAI